MRKGVSFGFELRLGFCDLSFTLGNLFLGLLVGIGVLLLGLGEFGLEIEFGFLQAGDLGLELRQIGLHLFLLALHAEQLGLILRFLLGEGRQTGDFVFQVRALLVDAHEIFLQGIALTDEIVALGAERHDLHVARTVGRAGGVAIARDLGRRGRFFGKENREFAPLFHAQLAMRAAHGRQERENALYDGPKFERRMKKVAHAKADGPHNRGQLEFVTNEKYVRIGLRFAQRLNISQHISIALAMVNKHEHETLFAQRGIQLFIIFK